eukprot:5538438-Prymnesium_polylepis.1
MQRPGCHRGSPPCRLHPSSARWARERRHDAGPSCCRIGNPNARPKTRSCSWFVVGHGRSSRGPDLLEHVRFGLRASLFSS